MYVSSTPLIVLEFESDFDLNKVEKLDVTIKSVKPNIGKFIKSFDKSEVLVDPDKYTISIQLSQEDTLDLKGIDTVAIQVKYKLDSGMVDYTDIVTLPVKAVLKDDIL